MIARISRPMFSSTGHGPAVRPDGHLNLFLLATSLAILTRSSTIVEVGHADTTQSFYDAEAGVNRGLAEFKNIFQGYNVPTGSDFSARNFTINGAAVRYQLSAVAGYRSSYASPRVSVMRTEQHRLPVHQRLADAGS
jgi:hypothetical protein